MTDLTREIGTEVYFEPESEIDRDYAGWCEILDFLDDGRVLLQPEGTSEKVEAYIEELV